MLFPIANYVKTLKARLHKDATKQITNNAHKAKIFATIAQLLLTSKRPNKKPNCMHVDCNGIGKSQINSKT